jgi:small conductance mechanosensitive channel
VSKLLTDIGLTEAWVSPILTIGQVVIIAIVAFAAWAFVRVGVAQVAAHLLEREAEHEESGLPQVEMERRVRTLQRIVVRVAGAVIVVIAALTALSGFGVNIGPAVAGLGVAGIAVGLGAQTLVHDWLAGIFVILENQYNVGDVVEVAGIGGVVEEFSLRRTMLRDLDGTLHSVPNGQIGVASNMTRSWARVNLNVEVAYDTDIDHATAVVNALGQELQDDPAWSDKMLEPPAVARVDSLGASGVELKVLGKVLPAQQWAVTGELRKRILARFAREGIEIPFPHRVVISRTDSADETDGGNGDGDGAG